MRFRAPHVVGAVIGVALACAVVQWGNTTRARPTGRMLSEHGGTIRSVVLQYTHGSQFVWPVFKQFLEKQSPSLTVYIAAPAQEDFDEVSQAIGPVPCKLVPVLTHHEMTPWSRDRWVELLADKPGDPLTLLPQRGELQQELWPQRLGDSKVADDLGRFLSPNIRATRSSLYFDGGDLLCDANYVFATPAVLQRNIEHTVDSRARLLDVLSSETLCKPVLMEEAPDHHAGMYMMAVGNHRMLVGDPSHGLPLLNRDAPMLTSMTGGPDETAQAQSRFDAVAKLTASLGYTVVRIPTIPGQNGKQYLTYVNVIMDQRDGKDVVYMPIYDDQPALNAAAQKVWESLGFEVIPINCTTTWPAGGTLHCLVNVLQRD